MEDIYRDVSCLVEAAQADREDFLTIGGSLWDSIVDTSDPNTDRITLYLTKAPAFTRLVVSRQYDGMVEVTKEIEAANCIGCFNVTTEYV